MNYDDQRVLDSICYDLVLGEYPRALNRAMINAITNGEAPYTEQEVEENNIAVNVNDLTHTRKMHDGRMQFANAFAKTYPSCRIQEGPAHKREEYSSVVTQEFRRPLKKSVSYFERQRAKFGMLVLHGISPGVWEKEDSWCPRPVGVEDVLIPSQTLLGFENLPFFVLRRSFTGIELQRLTAPEHRDEGWNMGLVDKVLRWVDSQTTQLRSTNWSEIWKPENVQERIKQDGGYYMGDQVPTVDCFDIYGYSDAGKKTGWVRRIILDAWGTPTQSGVGPSGKIQYTMSRKQKLGDLANASDFLYSSRGRKVADSWQNIISFQFADLSGVFPARYHSVRSMGWLMYAPCHIGNRMRCSFYESVFEALMQLFRVKSGEDVQKALKLNLINRGFIDETINPIPAAERWQVNAQLVQLGLSDNNQIIQENAGMFSQNQEYSRDRTEKTKFQVMAELNAVTALVGAAIAQAYEYEKFEDQEMLRRFFKRGSKNAAVKTFRANCLRRGVPEKYLHADCYEVEHDRVMGGGNKTMEMTIAQWLMEQRDKFDPEPQRKILRDAVIAVTDDASRAEVLVPENPVQVTDSIHDAQLVAGTLMQGLPVALKTGINHIEYVETLLADMALIVATIEQAGSMASPDQLRGLQNMANHITLHIRIIAQDPNERQRVRQYMDELSKLGNMLKAYEQRLIEAQQQAAQEGGNGHMTPDQAAKIEATQAQAQSKIETQKQSAAQRTAQRQIQFEQKLEQQSQQHALDLQQQEQEMQLEGAKADIEAAGEIERNRLKAQSETEAPEG